MTTAPVKSLWPPWRLSRPSFLGQLSRNAWIYWLAVVLSAVVAGSVEVALAHAHTWHGYWLNFFVLTALAALAQRLGSLQLARTRRAFHPVVVFVVAGAFLLPPGMLMLLVLVHWIPDWLKKRYPWYIQTFNIANYALGGGAAWLVARSIGFSGGYREAGAGAAAAVAFVIVNRGLLIPMLMLGRGLTLRETDLLDREDVGLEFVLAVTGVTLAVLRDINVVLALLALTPVFVIYFSQKKILDVEAGQEELEFTNQELEKANQEIENTTRETLEALARTVDAKDKYTAGHSRRVRDTAAKIAEELGLEGSELETVRQAAALHDIGKIRMPDSVLLKEGPLSASDWIVMRDHPNAGVAIIEPLGFLADVVPAIRHHHERQDGRGYPDGLVGSEIPLASRIIHVADALDAMTTDRPYRKALSPEVAMDELRRGRGTDFCERCVDALERALTAERFANRETEPVAAA